MQASLQTGHNPDQLRDASGDPAVQTGPLARIDWRGLLDNHKVCFAIIVLAAIIVRAPYMGDPAADYDEQLYSLIGQRWLQGELPYVDLWDRKPPGLFALYAAIHALFGPSPLAVHLVGLACTIIAGLQVFALGQKISTRSGALMATLIFLLNIPLFVIHLGQSETFLFLILLAQLALTIRAFTYAEPRKVLWLFAAAMMLGGLALQIKYSVLPFCALLAGLAFYRLRTLQMSWPRIFLALAGYAALGLAPTLIAFAYFASHGAFAAFFEANFLSILNRGEMAPQLVERFRTHLIVAAFPLLVFAILGHIEARKRSAVHNWQAQYLAYGFAGAGIVSLLMLGMAFLHYFGPLLPFLCLLSAPFFSFHKSRRLFVPLALGLALICASFPEQIERTTSHRAAVPELTAAIESHLPKGECLFVFDGPTALYSTTGRCILSPIVFPDHFTNPREAEALPMPTAAETARILALRPGAIVTSQGIGGELFNAQTLAMTRAALARDYTRVQVSFLYPRQIEVYVRNDLLTLPQRKAP